MRKPANSTRLEGKRLPRRIAESRGFLWQPVAAGDHVERRDDPFAFDFDLDATLRSEAFGATDVAVLAHVDDRLPIGVDIGGHKWKDIMAFCHFGASSRMVSKCSGTRALRCNSCATRRRSVSAASGSPWVR